MTKNIWKKCVASIGALALSATSSVCVGAQSFQLEQQGSKLVISGAGNADERVSVTLFKTGTENYADGFFVLDETYVGADGNYSITVVIPDTKEGISSNGDFELKVRVGAADAESCKIEGYISGAFRNDCVSQFKTKPTAELKAYLALNDTAAVMKILGVDMDTYNAMTDADKDRAISVLEESCQRDSLTEEEIRINLNKAVYIASLKNGAASKALSGINSTFDGISYKEISDSSLQSYLSESMSGESFANFSEYDTAYMEYNIFYLLNSANPTAMGEYLEKYADSLGISDEETYKRYLARTDKSTVCAALVTKASAKEISSVSELLDALSDAMKNPGGKDDVVIETGKGSSSSGGGSGGGRGSGGGGSFSAQQQVITGAKTEEAAEPIFTDIADYPWAEEAILALNEKGIVAGDGNGYYNPAENVTREEFSKILTLAMGIQDSDAQCSFSDVPTDSWYYMYVASLSQAGIINGIGDGLFGTGAGLTREDMTVMIYNAMKKTQQELWKVRTDKVFDDAAEISGYAKEAVKKLYAVGKVNGTGESFEPKRLCTRAEAAKIIYDAFVKGE